MTHTDFVWEDPGSSRARAALDTAEAAPPLRALRIAVPLPLSHCHAKLLHRAQLHHLDSVAAVRLFQDSSYLSKFTQIDQLLYRLVLT